MTTMTSLTCLLVIAEARELLLYFAVVHSKLFNNKSNTILCYDSKYLHHPGQRTHLKEINMALFMWLALRVEQC